MWKKLYKNTLIIKHIKYYRGRDHVKRYYVVLNFRNIILKIGIHKTSKNYAKSKIETTNVIHISRTYWLKKLSIKLPIMFFLTILNCISLLLFAEMLGNSRIPLLFKRNKITHKCVSTSQDRWAKFVTNVVCKSYYKEERGGRLKRTEHGWSVCPAAVTKFVGGILWKTSINTLLTFPLPPLYILNRNLKVVVLSLYL